MPIPEKAGELGHKLVANMEQITQERIAQAGLQNARFNLQFLDRGKSLKALRGQLSEKGDQQYDGDLEKYLLDLGDATKITAVISHNFNAVELLGLRELMIQFDYKRIRQYEHYWRQGHRIPDSAPSTIFKDPAPAKKATAVRRLDLV